MNGWENAFLSSCLMKKERECIRQSLVKTSDLFWDCCIFSSVWLPLCHCCAVGVVFIQLEIQKKIRVDTCSIKLLQANKQLFPNVTSAIPDTQILGYNNITENIENDIKVLKTNFKHSVGKIPEYS